MDTLVVHPFKRLQESGQSTFEAISYAILIDGLDECAGENRQVELLAAIKHCLLESDLSFRVCIASRPVWAVRSALQSGGICTTFSSATRTTLQPTFVDISGGGCKTVNGSSFQTVEVRPGRGSR
jgi:hypothetical protein